MIKLALLCGGPSLERGISLNSARSLLDHLSADDITIIPIYFDSHKNAYEISTTQLYSNTPSDFDFKLQKTAKPLSHTQLIKRLKQVDLAFPAIHGHFGEDGQVQQLLEKHHIPFIGSGSQACQNLFDKFRANEFIKSQGFFTCPSIALSVDTHNPQQKIKRFFEKNNIKRAIVKPAGGGSSIGVFSVNTVAQVFEKAKWILHNGIDTRVVIEPFAYGKEFTVIILQNRFNLPVALTPTEIDTDYSEHQIFDYRKKYLPSSHVSYHCPPRFNDDIIETIQVQAEQLFSLFGMKDFARFDGWVFPDGRIWFSDFNPISGMEQNSFLFMQASRVGMTHCSVLRHIVSHACQRYQLSFQQHQKLPQKKRKKVAVLFGGNNSERQVSLMSGSNVWLKLRSSKKYIPQAYLLHNNTVWKLPYHLILNHTVEEIEESCQQYESAEHRLNHFEQRSRRRLGLFVDKNHQDFFRPQKMTLNRFIRQAPFVFIALHGGMGENGTLQKKLAQQRIKFNGANSDLAKLCMDKWKTSRAVETLAILGVNAIAHIKVSSKKLQDFDTEKLQQWWRLLQQKLGGDSFIIKPNADGCSSGVVHISHLSDLKKYQRILKQGLSLIDANTFSNQQGIIEMPSPPSKRLLVEQFIASDNLVVEKNTIQHRKHCGWLEVTVAVVKIKSRLHIFNPSVTIASGQVLSVEEKFQGGTGINITPPPSDLISPLVLAKIKRRIGLLCKKLGIDSYARIDCFVQVDSGEVLIIEINSLPALTPSTVLYHQALAEKKPLMPTQLIENLISTTGY